MRIVSDSKIPFALQAFGQFGEVTLLETPEITASTVRQAEILLVRSETAVDQPLLEGSSVRFVGTATIGIDHVDTDYLEARGIGFSSAPGSNANSVAEYIIAALLVLSRKLDFSLRNKVLGVVGVGNIGSKVVRYAETMGMKVLQNDPPRARETGQPQFLSLDDLMDSDILTLHVPLTMQGDDATYHLFDRARISRMKEGSVLMNTSRGAVVEGEALKSALHQRHLSATVLDVWENEPKIDVDLLRLVDLGTPHVSGYSFDGKVNGTRMLYDALCRFTGQQSTWNTRDLLSSESDHSVSTDDGRLEPVLFDAVRCCYDIESDDEKLKGMVSLPEDQRGPYFRDLRAHYPVRREFSSLRVLLKPRGHYYGEVLDKLGFVVEYRQDLPA